MPDVFKFKDSLGGNLSYDKLPFTSAVKTKSEFSLNGIQIAKKSGGFWRANLKVSPLIDHIRGKAFGRLDDGNIERACW